MTFTATSEEEIIERLHFLLVSFIVNVMKVFFLSIKTVEILMLMKNSDHLLGAMVKGGWF